MRELISKKVSPATENEIKKIRNYIINITKKDNEPMGGLTIDEEIDYSIDLKNSIISATKVELVFNTKEVIVFIIVIELRKEYDETPCYDSEEDMCNRENEFIDPNGNFLFSKSIYQIDGENIFNITQNDYLFHSSRTKVPTL